MTSTQPVHVRETRDRGITEHNTRPKWTNVQLRDHWQLCSTKVPEESERGVLMGLLGAKQGCEAKVGQMVAANERVGAGSRRGRLFSGKAEQQRLGADC